jgi:hypothetical protein
MERVQVSFGTCSIVLLSLVVRRTRACMANMANTISALTMRMSCSHLTTTCGQVSRGSKHWASLVLTASLHAMAAFSRLLPVRYLGKNSHEAISRVQNLLVLSLPLIINVSDLQPNWSLPFAV